MVLKRFALACLSLFLAGCGAIEVGFELPRGWRANTPWTRVGGSDRFRVDSRRELVSNAICHARAEHVTVTLILAENMLTLRVSDDGIGLEAGQLERVFGMFERVAPAVGEHQGGLGIGLALARRLAALHGGTLHAESEGRGRGACFVLRLPRAGPDGR